MGGSQRFLGSGFRGTYQVDKGGNCVRFRVEGLKLQGFGLSLDPTPGSLL